MKKFILIISLFISSFAFSQDITVVHFNYEWNTRNAFKPLDDLKSAQVKYAYIENQSKTLQESIKSVPTIIVYKGQRPIAKFEAGLSMKIEIELEELQEIINKHKD
tara:strand:- start:671 stop:988 length:318 start_codon:yes stop_codon:yes gene_type:complete